jgi:dynein light intermediate chain 1
MRDGFEAKLWGEAWERDIEAEESEVEQPGAKKMFSRLVPDQGTKVCRIVPLSDIQLISCE